MAISNAVNAHTAGVQCLTSAGVWNGRTITAGTGISVSNGDGVSGNPTISTTGTGSGLLVATLNITNSQWKNINSNPQTIIAAPGASKFIMVFGAMIRLNYGGTNNFTGSGLAQIISQSNSCAIFTALAASWNGTSSLYTQFIPVSNAPAATVINSAVAINVSGANPAGNAANNNTISVAVYYLVADDF